MRAVIVFVLALHGVSSLISGKPCKKELRGDTIDCLCTADYCDTISVPDNLEDGLVYVYTSSASGQRFHPTRSDLKNIDHPDVDTTFYIETQNISQEILGFGGALTDATGSLLSKLSDSARDKFLDSFFSSDGGIEYSFVRLPIGGTDFSSRKYTEDFTKGELELECEDLSYKIPNLHGILSRNPEVKIVGTTWEAPSWMLTKDETDRDVISPAHYRQWAQYHRKFFDLYKEKGIQFWGATTGNEIVVAAFSVPWSMNEHQIWVNEHLGPVLEEAGYGNLTLLFLDDQTPYIIPWINLLRNETTKKYLNGVATHWYVDEKAYLYHYAFHASFPDKLIINTEASLCEYEDDFEEKTRWYGAELYAENIIMKLNSFCNGWIDWNMALDVNGGPNYKNNLCTASVVIEPEKDRFLKGPIFYAMGHFSKFIPPGSRQIRSSAEPQSRFLKIAAFETVNRSWDVAIVILNKGFQDVTSKVCIDKECGIVKSPARSIVTAVAKASAQQKPHMYLDSGSNQSDFETLV